MEQLNDKINDVYAMTYAISMFVSPNIGALMYNAFGPRRTGDYVAIVNLSVFLIFFVFNGGFSVFKENRNF